MCSVRNGFAGFILIQYPFFFRQETLPVTDKKDKPLFLFRPDQTLTT